MVKRFKKVITFLFITLSFDISYADSEIKQHVLDMIENTNIDEACMNILIYASDKDNGAIPVDKVIEVCKYVRENKINYKKALYAIAKHESGNFRYDIGIYNKNDVSYFQLNWNNRLVRDIAAIYNIYTKEDLRYSDKAAQIALSVWIYNIAIFYKRHGWFPRGTAELISIYHSSKRVKYSYYKKIRQIINSPEFENIIME